MIDPRGCADIRQVPSAHGDYWYQADCDFCSWTTDGWESVVEDAAWNHVSDNHPRRLARA